MRGEVVSPLLIQHPEKWSFLQQLPHSLGSRILED